MAGWCTVVVPQSTCKRLFQLVSHLPPPPQPRHSHRPTENSSGLEFSDITPIQKAKAAQRTNQHQIFKPYRAHPCRFTSSPEKHETVNCFSYAVQEIQHSQPA